MLGSPDVALCLPGVDRHHDLNLPGIDHRDALEDVEKPLHAETFPDIIGLCKAMENVLDGVLVGRQETCYGFLDSVWDIGSCRLASTRTFLVVADALNTVFAEGCYQNWHLVDGVHAKNLKPIKSTT